MTLYTTSMDIPDLLESIESAPDQKEAIASYERNNAVLGRFLRWYAQHDLTEVQKDLDYIQSGAHPVLLAQRLGDLEALSKYNLTGQKTILSNILSCLDHKAMMLLENCLTKDLKSYYPAIDWDVVEDYFKIKL